MNNQATITKEQYNEILALAYWVADARYIQERYGSNEPEIDRCKKTLTECVFPALDDLQVPFWIQNAVIGWADNWRNYADGHVITFLKSKHIYVA